MQEQTQPPKPIYKRKEFVFSSVLVALLAVLLLSSRMTGRPPQIESITPKIGYTGEVMVVTGRYFGADRDGGEVVIGGYSPVSSGYLEWTDSRISLRIPEEAHSGMARVITRNGRSRGLLFTNREEIPVVLSGPGNPGQPYISDVAPRSAAVGSLLTISGMNFGLKRGSSVVSFTWISGEQNGKAGQPVTTTPALDYDQDYEIWSDREIQVRVPDGASSGHLTVVTDKGSSNAVYLEIESSVGAKLFPDRRTYAVQYSVEVKDVAGEPPNSLYLWMPQIASAPEQREIQLVAQEPQPLFDDVNGLKLFRLEDLQPGDSATIMQNLMFDRYSVETKVNVGRVGSGFDTDRRLYKRYTAADQVVPSEEERIQKLGAAIVGRERNPYRKAQAIYSWVLKRLQVAEEPVSPDVMAALETNRGDSYIYAVLFCALARSVGIPSRPVAGYLVDRDLSTARHYWAEFYLEKLGWVPVDPILGEGKMRVPLPPQADPTQYYFGNLDFSHIAFSKGLIPVNQMDPAGRVLRRTDIPSLQSIHEEAVGGLASYSAAWMDLNVLGVY